MQFFPSCNLLFITFYSLEKKEKISQYEFHRLKSFFNTNSKYLSFKFENNQLYSELFQLCEVYIFNKKKRKKVF